MEELEGLSKKEVLGMLKFGADRIFSNSEGRPPSDAELDAIIDRSNMQATTAAQQEGPSAGVKKEAGREAPPGAPRSAVQRGCCRRPRFRFLPSAKAAPCLELLRSCELGKP
jgi:hypothetical protein